METRLALPVDPTSSTDSGLNLNVVVAFEDFETGARAKSTLDRVKDQLGRQEMSLKLWKFDWLREPGVRRQAARDAREALLIILSSHGRGEWPAPVKEWMATWREPPTDQPRALVALLDSETNQDGASHPMLTYLQDMARDARLELFFRFCEPRPLALNSIFEQIQDRAERSPVVLEGVPAHPAAREVMSLVTAAATGTV